ncbi:hypothetical protein IFR05_000514 [Cadophora sp. M221]|nr:hypothetical protein IFR05_000514 [Cadophora sp. M221]
MKPTFHLAPRLTIIPPPDGPLHLGTIIDNLTDVEPLNESCRLPLPTKEQKHTSTGFVATRSELIKGKYGIWAKFAGIEGIGGELSLSNERTAEDTYRFEKLEEISFTATKAYMTESMNKPDVKEFVEGGGWDPVYIITGLKIARGPSVELKKGKKLAVKANLGLTHPGGVQGFDVGPKAEYETDPSSSVTFEKSDDFIYGIRVKRLYFKRGLFLKKPGGVVGEHFHSGATLVDNDSVFGNNLDEVEEGEIGDEDEEVEDKEWVVDGEETWVVPRS